MNPNSNPRLGIPAGEIPIPTDLGDFNNIFEECMMNHPQNFPPLINPELSNIPNANGTDPFASGFPARPDFDPAMFPETTVTEAAGGSSSLDLRSYEGVGAVNIVQIIICTIGLIANITVILLVLILKELKKGITVWYILQLAIADTLFLITIPFQVIEDQNAAWIYGEWLCKAKQTVMFINYYASISFLTVMAFDRYIAVCHIFSETLPKLRSRKAAYIITIIVWSVCILISIPAMLYSAVQGPKPNCKCEFDFSQPKTLEEKCAEVSDGDAMVECICLKMPYEESLCINITALSMPGLDAAGQAMPPLNDTGLQMGCHYGNHPYAFKVFILVNFVVMFLLPLLVITLCYLLIIAHLRKTTFRGDGGNSSSESHKRKKRVIYMCITLIAIFTACWLPYHAQHLAKFAGMPGKTASFCNRLSHITALIVYLNSAINPFIYFIIARFKSHVSNITRSRAASAVLTLFSRNGQRTMSTRQTTNLEKSKGDTRSTEGKTETRLNA